MNIRTGKAISLLALGLVLPMGIARGQATGSLCNDGTTSASTGKGTCSGHGGVKSTTKPVATQAGKTTSTTKTKTTTKTESKTATKTPVKTTTKSESKTVTKAPVKTATKSATKTTTKTKPDSAKAKKPPTE